MRFQLSSIHASLLFQLVDYSDDRTLSVLSTFLKERDTRRATLVSDLTRRG